MKDGNKKLFFVPQRKKLGTDLLCLRSTTGKNIVNFTQLYGIYLRLNPRNRKIKKTSKQNFQREKWDVETLADKYSAHFFTENLFCPIFWRLMYLYKKVLTLSFKDNNFLYALAYGM